jgi:hypothetical protein
MVHTHEASRELWRGPIVTGDEYLPIEQDITYDDLFDMYANSAIGIHHATQPPRWSQYGVSDGALHSVIGLDAHPLSHMIDTHNLAVEVAARESVNMSHLQLTSRELAVLRTAMLLHDMGENTHPDFANTCGVVGDIPFGLKTDEQRATEAAVRKIIWDNKYHFFLPEDFRAEAEAVINHTGNTRVVKTAQAAHTLGALEAAAQAYDAGKYDTDLDTTDREHLIELALDAARQLARKALPSAMEFDCVRERVTRRAGPELLEDASADKLHAQSELRVRRVSIQSSL